MSKVSTSTAPSSSLFVGSHLDDAGLDVYQFRILGHLHRRAGSDGRAWPSVGTIAEVCKIGERVVRRSLRTLVKLGYVTATPRPGRTTLYRPVTQERSIENPRVLERRRDRPVVEPLADQPPPPLADQPDEGIPSEGIPTPAPAARKAPPVAPPEPLARPEHVGGGGSAERKKTAQNVKKEPLSADQKEAARALGENGIIGRKLESLARSGLSAKEIRRTCRKVAESGGRSGAMILHLEAAAGRKAEGQTVTVGFTFKPAEPLPEWEDTLSAAERAELVEACRKFRQAG